MKQLLKSLLAVSKAIAVIFIEILRAIYNIAFTKPKDISNEIVLITGGGRGIGRKIALEFAKYRPKHIIIWGRKEEWLKRTSEDIQTLGVKSTYQICDVSKREIIYEKANDIQNTIGDVTVLVNNAGILIGKPIEHLEPEDMIQALNVNTLAHIWTMKAFLPAMIENGEGHIVCMNSVLGILGLKGVCDYTTSKFAATGLMESVMLELEDCPGIHTTRIHPYQAENNMFAGMTVRFPKLFPKLKEEYVAIATVQAVLTNRKQITIPIHFYFVFFFRSVLPISCMVPIQRFFGLDKVMEKFDWRNGDPDRL